MTATFTPGPWIARDSHYDYWAVSRASGQWVATTSFGSDDEEADARLIASAPDLLSALALFIADERFVVTMGGNPNVVDAALSQARAAYARATGAA